MVINTASVSLVLDDFQSSLIRMDYDQSLKSNKLFLKWKTLLSELVRYEESFQPQKMFIFGILFPSVWIKRFIYNERLSNYQGIFRLIDFILSAPFCLITYGIFSSLPSYYSFPNVIFKLYLRLFKILDQKF